VLVIIEMKFTALVDPFLGFPIAEISELKVSLIVFLRFYGETSPPDFTNFFTKFYLTLYDSVISPSLNG
jgi:hypothetical protein